MILISIYSQMGKMWHAISSKISICNTHCAFTHNSLSNRPSTFSPIYSLRHFRTDISKIFHTYNNKTQINTNRVYIIYFIPSPILNYWHRDLNHNIYIYITPGHFIHTATSLLNNIYSLTHLNALHFMSKFILCKHTWRNTNPFEYISVLMSSPHVMCVSKYIYSTFVQQYQEDSPYVIHVVYIHKGW